MKNLKNKNEFATNDITKDTPRSSNETEWTIIGGIKKWIRICRCGKILAYSCKTNLNRAIKENAKCYSCSSKERIFSKEHKQNISISKKGKNHPNFGKCLADKTRKKISNANKGQISWWKGKTLSKKHKHKLHIANKGQIPWIKNKHHSKETIKKLRLIRIKQIENRCGQVMPNYHIPSIKIWNEINNQLGWNLQHAENGGEYYIKELGYWLDAYDKYLNIVIEHNELHHEKQIIKDTNRQQEIIKLLGCKFYVIQYNQNWKEILKEYI